MRRFAESLFRLKGRWPRRIDRSLRTVDGRAGTRAFWEVQTMVIAVTLLHYAIEMRVDESRFEDLHHVPVILYLIPITYASIRFGRYGGVRTGLWSLVLSIPNIVVLHEEWASATVEIAQVAAGIGVGIVLSATVDGERALRQRAERLAEQLQGVNTLILRAQEDERLYIARELHDDAVQRLIHICQRLDMAAAHVTVADSLKREVVSIRAEAEETADRLRRFSRDLRPPILDDLGLVPAVEALVSETGEPASIRKEVHVQGEVRRLEPEAELTSFRIVQEALHNAVRHAHPTRVTITLKFTPALLHISVEDDGDGFVRPESPNDLIASGHLGLAGMFERARLIGATLDIQTAPHRGTRVLFDVPTADSVRTSFGGMTQPQMNESDGRKGPTDT